ncbi:MAG TPA: hypothetical protein VG796_29685 [Verrucomicrobiales bacterium]|nr:hypothetical protein [Verrucomicrobiales bacterium]
MSGGHPETEGITPDGRVVEVIEHAHEVDLDLTRYELGVSRTFNDTWDAFIRIPYFIKDQRAETVFPNGGSPEDRDAAIRAGFYHHRTELYEGFADLELGAGWRTKGLFGENSVARFSLGFTIPAGETQSDPLRAGDLGLPHLHIQFGNGTFDPVADFYLGVPIKGAWAFSLYGKGRFPLYENSHGYLGSVEGTLIPRVTYLPSKKLSFSAGIAANYYGYSEWHGRRDPNSGQFTLNASLGTGYKFNEHLTASFNLLLPFYTDTFSGEDSLDPAPTFAVSAAWTF